MSDFINTADVLGDDAVTDSIIDRSITEYHDDTVITVNTNAFNTCSALTNARIPVARVINAYAFADCPALTSVDTRDLRGIDSYAFVRCSNLVALILRYEGGIASAWASNIFDNTPIKSGTGYIYVPSAFVDRYKAATNWSNFASKFRALEDYTVDGTVTGELDPTKI